MGWLTGIEISSIKMLVSQKIDYIISYLGVFTIFAIVLVRARARLKDRFTPLQLRRFDQIFLIQGGVLLATMLLEIFYIKLNLGVKLFIFLLIPFTYGAAICKNKRLRWIYLALATAFALGGIAQKVDLIWVRFLTLDIILALVFFVVYLISPGFD